MPKLNRSQTVRSRSTSSATTSDEIVADNVRATAPLYAAMMFEELKVFAVVDRLVQLFQEGALPIGRSVANRNAIMRGKAALSLATAAQRHKLYIQFFGVGGDGDPSANREFNDLWMRFISAVSSFQRQSEVDSARVNKAARELAANLSQRGKEPKTTSVIKQQISGVSSFFSTLAINRAFGGRDMWQVVDDVATAELGGAKNAARYRTMMTAGLTVIAWLAKNAPKLSSVSDDPIIKPRVFCNPARPLSNKATSDPSDTDLVNACKEWLLAAKLSKAKTKS